MAVEWKNVITILGVLFLMFFAVPIRIDSELSDGEVQKFEKYISNFNKTYEALEYHDKLTNFKRVLKIIKELNSNRTSNDSALYGLTKFSDLTPEQFQSQFLQEGRHIHHRRKYVLYPDDGDSSEKNKISKRAIVQLPPKVDWRGEGIIGEIRDQLNCGACWAFSTIETVESMTALKTGKLPTLSVQEVIDCARNGNLGCQGGDPCNLLEWLLKNNVSVVPEKNYPLKWSTNACQLYGKNDGVRLASFKCKNLVGQEDEILSTLAHHGPVSVAVNALTWQFYTGGVIQYHCDGNPLNLNHVVQLVGYDQTTNIPHYIARNSWGNLFGDNGYVYIAIGKNMCGLGNEVSSLDITAPVGIV